MAGLLSGGQARRSSSGGPEATGALPPVSNPDPSRVLHPGRKRNRTSGDCRISAARADGRHGHAAAGTLGAGQSGSHPGQCHPDLGRLFRLHRGGDSDATSLDGKDGAGMALSSGFGAAAPVAALSGRTLGAFAAISERSPEHS